MWLLGWPKFDSKAECTMAATPRLGTRALASCKTACPPYADDIKGGTLPWATPKHAPLTFTKSEGKYRSLCRLLTAATARSPSNVGNCGGLHE